MFSIYGYFTQEKQQYLYKVWGWMKSRCNNPNDTAYHYYGERGISVCNEWQNNSAVFIGWALANGWEKGLVIDRKNNDGNYEPSNCRFVTHSESNINQRKRKDNSSGYRGINFHKGSIKRRAKDCWDARIQYEGKRKQIGSFETATEAAIARDKYIKMNNLPHILNFNEGIS